MLEQPNNQELGVWQLYLFTLKPPQTREKYKGRMEKFFDFGRIGGKTIEEKNICFVEEIKY